MRRKTFFKILIILCFIALFGVAYLFLSKDNIVISSNLNKPWQAVYLNNSQIYFGHITELENGVLHLTDVYTLQSFQEPADVSSSESFSLKQEPKTTYKLVKKGTDKIITTDNAMTINLNSVVYWEKLTAESQVVKLIEEQK